jgi:hypothetical protein
MEIRATKRETTPLEDLNPLAMKKQKYKHDATSVKRTILNIVFLFY